jgi:hypothetical protein
MGGGLCSAFIRFSLVWHVTQLLGEAAKITAAKKRKLRIIRKIIENFRCFLTKPPEVKYMFNVTNQQFRVQPIQSHKADVSINSTHHNN